MRADLKEIALGIVNLWIIGRYSLEAGERKHVDFLADCLRRTWLGFVSVAWLGFVSVAWLCVGGSDVL